MISSANPSTDRSGTCAPRRACRRPLTSIARSLWPYATAIACLSGAVGAQAPDTAHVSAVAVGTRVRLWEQAARDLSLPVVGTLSRITSDTIDIRANGSDSPRGVPRQLVTRVEISLGPHSGSRSASAWMGAAIGGLGAGILGIIAGNLSRSNAARLGLVGAIGGAGVGAAIGASQPGEAWRRAVLPPASPAGP